MYSRALSNRSSFKALSVCSAAVGLSLLAANLAGFVIPLRANDVSGYRDFAGGNTLDYETVVSQLDHLAENNNGTVDLVTKATRLFHEGIAHISPKDVVVNGLDYYRMRVPISENWVLFALSYFKPDTYRDYEFCNYRRALERGTGRCGQQSMALVSYLADLDVETGFVKLRGHVVATADVGGDNWYLLDPDYGGVVPFDISTVEHDPDVVLSYYWNSAARDNRLNELYASENTVKYGGPRARYSRACPIEYLSYVVKWVVPTLMLFPLFLVVVLRRSTT